MFYDLCTTGIAMRDGRDGVVCVVFVNTVRNGGCDVIGIHFVTSDGGQETVGVVFDVAG